MSMLLSMRESARERQSACERASEREREYVRGEDREVSEGGADGAHELLGARQHLLQVADEA